MRIAIVFVTVAAALSPLQAAQPPAGGSPALTYPIVDTGLEGG